MAPTETGTTPWIRIRDAATHVGDTVEIRGWVTHRRSSGKVQFLVLRDGSGQMQCVAGVKDLSPEQWEASGALTQESAVIARGVVKADARQVGGVELGLSTLEVVSVASEYPITPKEHGVDFLMDHRHLWLRAPRQQAILRIRAEIINAFRDFMDHEGFVLVDAPIFTPNACEGTTTLFETQYFDDKAYLSQSGQLYMEAAAMALGRVYCFGPAFRAEKSKTRRHLIEFWMMEPEWAWATLDDVVALEERLLVATVGRVLDRCREDLKLVERDTTQARARARPVPAHPLQRRGPHAARGRSRVRVGQRLRRPGRDRAVEPLRHAHLRHPLSRGGEGVLHGARSGRRRGCRCPATASRPRATARSSAAASAWQVWTC